jgi:hypothetical protein
MPAPLSDAVKELISKARIVSFESWHSTHTPAAIALFQAADDQGRYLSDADFQQLQVLVPDTLALAFFARLFQEQVGEIVDEARLQLLSKFPTITQPGGALYPSERAEACWRDFWHFLRCITYGIAAQHSNYTSAQGLHYLRLLYQELHVPLDAMIVGLEEIKTASLNRVELAQQATLAPYFDHLIHQLSHFQKSASLGLD